VCRTPTHARANAARRTPTHARANAARRTPTHARANAARRPRPWPHSPLATSVSTSYFATDEPSCFVTSASHRTSP
jgi:hypothetical protein